MRPLAIDAERSLRLASRIVASGEVVSSVAGGCGVTGVASGGVVVGVAIGACAFSSASGGPHAASVTTMTRTVVRAGITCQAYREMGMCARQMRGQDALRFLDGDAAKVVRDCGARAARSGERMWHRLEPCERRTDSWS